MVTHIEQTIAIKTHRASTYTFDHLLLQRGGRFGPITIAYETWGALNASRNNAILITPTLTAGPNVHDEEHPDDPSAAWWNFLVGPGCPIDTSRYFVICSNVLGGCYGSTGPSSLNPHTGRPYGMDFPVVTVRDMVHAQHCLVEHLGIQQLEMVIGGSFGGQQSLEWAVTYPELVRKVIVVEATAALMAQAIAFSEVGRQAIMIDPLWQNGNYPPGQGPSAGLAIARMLGMITYLSEEILETRFARSLTDHTSIPTPSGSDDLGCRFEVESYLYYLVQTQTRHLGM